MESVLHEKIRRSYSELTRSQKALSCYILQHNEEVPFLASAELARKVNVSDATVTRFCVALGYSGYADFQKDIQKWIQIRLTPSDRLRKPALKREGNIFMQILERDFRNLGETFDDSTLRKLAEAVRALNHSRKVFIIGLRTSFSLAWLLYYLLSRILRNIYLLDPAYGTLYDSLINIGPKDTLVAFTFSPYIKTTLDVAQYAKKQGCRILSITDSVLSPLALISDIAIRVKIDTLGFIGSYTSAITIINCLAIKIARENPVKSVNALKEFEILLPKVQTWVVDRPSGRIIN